MSKSTKNSVIVTAVSHALSVPIIDHIDKIVLKDIVHFKEEEWKGKGKRKKPKQK